MQPLDPHLIYSYVGNGAPALVRRAMGSDSSEELVREALTFFLNFYRAHALEHTQLYPGVQNLIEDLSIAGHKLAILTNKPVRISTDIMGALGLQRYFLRIYGGNSFPHKKPDPIGVATLIGEAGVDPSECLLVGDSGVDIRTARNAGVRNCGVLWGFQPEAFEAEPPDFLISRPQELLERIADFR